jgi:hypothetical protein
VVNFTPCPLYHRHLSNTSLASPGCGNGEKNSMPISEHEDRRCSIRQSPYLVNYLLQKHDATRFNKQHCNYSGTKKETRSTCDTRRRGLHWGVPGPWPGPGNILFSGSGQLQTLPIKNKTEYFGISRAILFSQRKKL